MTGWVRFPKSAPRREFRSLTAGNRPVAVRFEKISDRILPTQVPAPADVQPPAEASVAAFWVQDLPPHSIRRYQYSDREVTDEPVPTRGAVVEADQHGWPKSVSWPGMKKPLFLSGTGDFLAVEAHAARSVVEGLAAGRGSDGRASHFRASTMTNFWISPATGNACAGLSAQRASVTTSIVAPRKPAAPSSNRRLFRSSVWWNP